MWQKDLPSLSRLCIAELTRLCGISYPSCNTPPSSSRFHSKAIPSISLADYVERIIRYASIDPLILLTMLIYNDRLLERYLPGIYYFFRNHSLATTLSVHRFIITSIMIATKALCDSYLSNTRYSKIGGLGVKELNVLEVEMLFMINFKLIVSVSDCNVVSLYTLRLTNI
jgi:hypothetical protein